MSNGATPANRPATTQDEREAATCALVQRLKLARQDQLVILMELLRVQFACQELAELCANLRRNPDLRRQAHPVPDLPSSARIEDLLARLRDAGARADACAKLLRDAGVEP